MTARFFVPEAIQARTRVLLMTEIKTVHESAEELAAIVDRVGNHYELNGKCWCICTDRASINTAAFRHATPLLALLNAQTIWLPCTCHMLNNVLSMFFGQIGHVMRPILRIQSRFRKSGPFMTFLTQKGRP